MGDPRSVTRWIRGLEAGEQAAAEALWGRYFEKLVRIARRKLEGTPRRAADEEDVALSAFHAFCRAAQEGRYPQLADRDDLWRVLITITARKAVDLLRHTGRKKRRVLGESALARQGDGSAGDLDEVIGDTPSPEFAAQLGDECRRLLELLDDPALQALAIAKLEGRTNGEIARNHGCSIRTVERRLHLVRRKWEWAVGANDPPTSRSPAAS
jgi:DNA-directed RNA polymerase specialized sigma24 family protein